MIADILLVAGALGAGFYCYILARRLSRFNDLENGVGGAVAVLSAQVDDLTKALKQAQSTASVSYETLEGLTDRAETVSRQLELMMASMHDVPRNEPPRSPTVENAQSTVLATPSHPQPANPKAEELAGPVFSRHARDRAEV